MLFSKMRYIEIALEYKDNKLINEFVKSIPVIFDNKGIALYDKRNIIKSFSINSLDIPFQKLVVKKFKSPNLFQSIAYSFFRSSKAVRAFNNATELRKRKINTPQEIAYIEEYQNKLLKSSYVITGFTDGQPIRDFFLQSEGFNPIVAEEFARFAVELHRKGILHHDLNSTNVLYHQSEQGNYFSVIDINRMEFKSSREELSPAECFDNLTRFTGLMELFEYVLRHYIKYRDWNADLLEDAIQIKKNHDKQWARKKAFFNNLKKIHHV